MIPVVLSGGSGTRLWPVSRASFPKPFNDLVGEALLTQTLRRLSPFGEPFVVAAAQTAPLVRGCLADAGLPEGNAVFEPVGRNTAPAVALACHRVLAAGQGEAVLGIFPADHLIEDQAGFETVVRLAERCAEDGHVVTLGVQPSRPATGYGYIEVSGKEIARDGGTVALEALGFREKPDLETARGFLEAGTFLWNAGMFVFKAEVMAALFARHMPELWAAVTTIDPELSNLGAVYETVEPESFDYGVMEHLPGHVSIPIDVGWSDIGSWDEVARLAPPASGVFEHAGGNNFVFPHRDRIYGLVGVEDLVVVDSEDALLISRRGQTESVKAVVDQVRDAGRAEATEHTFEHRPWGSFEILRDTSRFKSKILRVAPHQRLSYQSHQHRSEHWVIVAGRPRIVLDGEILEPEPGTAVYIPQGAKHRIENPTDEPVEIVEVQLGTYFGEDDIERYEDDYDRVAEGVSEP